MFSADQIEAIITINMAVETLVKCEALTADEVRTAELMEPNYHGIVESVDLRLCGWSDYSGSAYDRSNMRSLIRDYPEFLGSYGSDSHGHALTLDWGAFVDEANADRALECAEALYGVSAYSDYALHSDNDHSALEWELAGEWWDYCGKEIYDALKEHSDVDFGTFNFGDEMFSAFFRAYSDIRNDYGYAETATSYVFSDATGDDVIGQLLHNLCRRLVDDFPRQCDGQDALFCGRGPAVDGCSELVHV